MIIGIKASVSCVNDRAKYNRAVAPCVLALCAVFAAAGSVYAVASGTTITYEGAVAGTVVFSGTTHAAKGLSCAACHESQGFSPALFKKERGGDLITMKLISKGRSCGSCHEVSLDNTAICDYCHRK